MEAALMETIVTLTILIRPKMVRMSSLDLNIRVVSLRQDAARKEETVLSAMKEYKSRSQRMSLLFTRFKKWEELLLIVSEVMVVSGL